MRNPRRLMPLFALFALALFALACGSPIDVVDAGTYEGRIAEVVPAEEEIYVNLDQGGRIELYFDEDTKLIRAGQQVEFSELEENARVRVTLTRTGNRNEPETVEILE